MAGARQERQERTMVTGSRRHVGQGPDEEPFKQKSRMSGVETNDLAWALSRGEKSKSSVLYSCLHLGRHHLNDSVRVSISIITGPGTNKQTH